MDTPVWPALNYLAWTETRETLHRWIQIVGKIRLSKTPWLNHGWHSTLYVNERGLTTSIIHDQRTSFTIDFDFISHKLHVQKIDGTDFSFPLRSESVASFHDRLMGELRKSGIGVRIFARPNELLDALPFEADEIHRTYDPEYANRFWRVLLQADRLLKNFRAGYIGKVSPVHFFWGALDLAVTRFSGRRAPEHPGGVPHLPDLITREAYSHEVSSCGFWPGNHLFPEPAFYSYAYPKPDGFEYAQMPAGAYYHPTLREFILPYELVRNSADPDSTALEFFQKTYEAAAELARWDRKALEHDPYFDLLSRHAAA